VERGAVIVLDTHAWVWWAADRSRLSRRARSAIEAERRLAISDVSVWEVAMLVAKGRLRLDRSATDWLEHAAALDRLEVVAIRPGIAVRSTQLGHAFQGDPADRLIVATALVEGASLVTKDDRIRASPAVATIW
jgi:PIN domain nuclease of toxin-antitoxin system